MLVIVGSRLSLSVFAAFFICMYKFALATRTSSMLHVSERGSYDKLLYTRYVAECHERAPIYDDVKHFGIFSSSLHWDALVHNRQYLQ